MSKMMLIVGADADHDEVASFVRLFSRFTTSMHCPASVLTIDYTDITEPPWWAERWNEAVRMHTGIVIVVPSSSLRHVFLEIVEKLLFPKSLCPVWIVHSHGGATVAQALEDFLEMRSALLYPRSHFAPNTPDSEFTAHALRFLNFGYTEGDR